MTSTQSPAMQPPQHYSAMNANESLTEAQIISGFHSLMRDSLAQGRGEGLLSDEDIETGDVDGAFPSSSCPSVEAHETNGPQYKSLDLVWHSSLQPWEPTQTVPIPAYQLRTARSRSRPPTVLLRSLPSFDCGSPACRPSSDCHRARAMISPSYCATRSRSARLSIPASLVSQEISNPSPSRSPKEGRSRVGLRQIYRAH
jgi:hypothetical protein